jgi:sugar/nucleoside kinase (ribokinase family)
VCTHGRAGSTGLSGDGEWFDVPSLAEIPVHDTNGAGDAYFAGYLYGQARDYDVLRCMQLGTLAGGLCVTSSELAHPDLSPQWVESAWRRHYDVTHRGTWPSRSGNRAG